MTGNEYQVVAVTTANRDGDAPTRLAVTGLGLAGEAGEVVEHIKKHLGHGQDLDLLRIEKELGDVMWYVAVMAYELGISLNDIMAKNCQKLRERWPNGFDITAPQAAGDNGR